MYKREEKREEKKRKRKEKGREGVVCLKRGVR